MSINEGDIYVNYGHVDNVEQALNDADNAIQRVLNQLQDVINPLRATWSGVSEDEYIQVQTREQLPQQVQRHALRDED